MHILPDYTISVFWSLVPPISCMHIRFHLSHVKFQKIVLPDLLSTQDSLPSFLSPIAVFHSLYVLRDSPQRSWLSSPASSVRLTHDRFLKKCNICQRPPVKCLLPLLYCRYNDTLYGIPFYNIPHIQHRIHSFFRTLFPLLIPLFLIAS